MSRQLVALFTMLGLLLGAAGSAVSHDDQHGTRGQDLPASKSNMKLISKLQLTDEPSGIADVSYFKRHAYLGAWTPECPGAGVHIVDIGDPQRPRKVGFAAAGAASHPGEGVDVFHIDTRFRTADILVTNNEACPRSTEKVGGVNLYDVTRPARPKPLVIGAGDRVTATGDVRAAANFVHSAMGWSVGRKAYVVMTDNEEALDVDILNVTNPAQPRLIAETGLPDWPGVVVDGHGGRPYHHDMQVKRISGHWYLLLSYWDAGFILLNVDDPANPRFVRESDYPETDLLGFRPPEGNGHQAWYSSSNRWILAADEDFSVRRVVIRIETGANAGDFSADEFDWAEQIHDRSPEEQAVAGPVVYGGRGCPDDPPPPEASTLGAAAGEETMVAFTRGTCFFSHKVEKGQNAGYDVVIVGNHHEGAEGGEAPDATSCGDKGHEFVVQVVAVCVGHRALHVLFDDVPEYQPVEDGSPDMPSSGTRGAAVRLHSVFDGWGYLNLVDAESFEIVDSYAPPQALQEEYAHVFPLSIHEIKTDWRKEVNLGYASWYKAGARVVSFGSGGLEEVGHFIDEDGNDFWGTYPVRRGERKPLLLFSDRDFGLYVLKYTGAAGEPVASTCSYPDAVRSARLYPRFCSSVRLFRD